MSFKQLLFINDYPPAAVAGAPIVARQLLKGYDQERLDVPQQRLLRLDRARGKTITRIVIVANVAHFSHHHLP